MKTLGLTLALGCAFAFGQACRDTSPIDFVVVPAEAGPGADAAAVFGEGGLQEACATCMAEGGCAAEWNACAGDDRCFHIANCLVEGYCFDFDITNLADLPLCLQKCALEAEVYSQDDPVVALAAPMIRCGVLPDGCGKVCTSDYP